MKRLVLYLLLFRLFFVPVIEVSGSCDLQTEDEYIGFSVENIEGKITDRYKTGVLYEKDCTKSALLRIVSEDSFLLWYSDEPHAVEVSISDNGKLVYTGNTYSNKIASRTAIGHPLSNSFQDGYGFYISPRSFDHYSVTISKLGDGEREFLIPVSIFDGILISNFGDGHGWIDLFAFITDPPEDIIDIDEITIILTNYNDTFTKTGLIIYSIASQEMHYSEMLDTFFVDAFESDVLGIYVLSGYRSTYIYDLDLKLLNILDLEASGITHNAVYSKTNGSLHFYDPFTGLELGSEFVLSDPYSDGIWSNNHFISSFSYTISEKKALNLDFPLNTVIICIIYILGLRRKLRSSLLLIHK